MTRFFIVIFLFFVNVGCTSFLQRRILDLRSACIDNATKNLFLPSDGGEIYSLVIYLSSKKENPHCQFNVFSYFYDIGLIMVLEFLGDGINCGPGEIFVKDEIETSICEHVRNKLYLHNKLVKNITILFNLNEHSTIFDIKVVITAANLLSSKSSRCEDAGKLSCLIGNETACIQKSLECNGDFNCGVRYKYDENQEICKALGWRSWLVVICSVSILLFCTLTTFNFINNNIIQAPVYFYEVGDLYSINKQVKPLEKKYSQQIHFKPVQDKLSSLTNQLYMAKNALQDDSLENSKSFDTRMAKNSTTITPSSNWTTSLNTMSSQNLGPSVSRSKKVNWRQGFNAKLQPDQSWSQELKQKFTSSGEVTDDRYGIKVTYYDT